MTQIQPRGLVVFKQFPFNLGSIAYPSDSKPQSSGDYSIGDGMLIWGLALIQSNLAFLTEQLFSVTVIIVFIIDITIFNIIILIKIIILVMIIIIHI